MWIGHAREWLGGQTTLVMGMSSMALAGLLMGRLGLRLPLWLGLLLVFVALIIRRRRIALLVILCCATFLIGLSRGGAYYDSMQPLRQYVKQKVVLQVRANDDGVYAENGQLSFTASDIKFLSPVQTTTNGSIRVKGYGEFAIYKGDIVELQGSLYPTKGAAQASMSYAHIKHVGGYQTWLDEFRRRFGAGMQTALPEPAASFGMGLLIGQRNTLPDDITMSLKMVGLTHIIAVSGYNLTIFLNGARRALGKRSKLLTTVVAVVLMVGFVSLTGASASIVRAVVVSSLSLAAWYVGRRARPMVIILLSAALTALWNPVYLWSDIGWYLSFLAFFGILVVAPRVTERLHLGKNVPVIVTMSIETLSAEIMTIPLVMMIFGQVSLVGLVANLLVAAAIPLAMLLSFVAGLAGMLLPLYSGWFAWPAKALLTYMLDVVELLSRVPHAYLTNRYMSTAQMVASYACIVAVTAMLYRPAKQSWLSLIAHLEPGEAEASRTKT